MKRTLALSAILLLAFLTATASAQSSSDRREQRFDNPILDDVVEMTRSQLPESTIVAFVRARKSRLSE